MAGDCHAAERYRTTSAASSRAAPGSPPGPSRSPNSVQARIVAVSEVARRYPRVADVILAVPLVVFAVYALMYLRTPDLAPIARMARQMLILVPLSLAFFVPVAFAERLHLTFWPAFALGLVLVAASVSTYLWFTTS